MQIHSLTTMIYIKQSNAIDRTWCQDTRKIHHFLCLILQKALLGYVIKLVSAEEQRETAAGGEAQQHPAHAAPMPIAGAISPSSPVSSSPGEHRDTEAGTTQMKDSEEGTPCVGPSQGYRRRASPLLLVGAGGTELQQPCLSRAAGSVLTPLTHSPAHQGELPETCQPPFLLPELCHLQQHPPAQR